VDLEVHNIPIAPPDIRHAAKLIEQRDSLRCRRFIPFSSALAVAVPYSGGRSSKPGWAVCSTNDGEKIGTCWWDQNEEERIGSKVVNRAWLLNENRDLVLPTAPQEIGRMRRAKQLRIAAILALPALCAAEALTHTVAQRVYQMTGIVLPYDQIQVNGIIPEFIGTDPKECRDRGIVFTRNGLVIRGEKIHLRPEHKRTVVEKRRGGGGTPNEDEIVVTIEDNRGGELFFYGDK
jgi:hypothetical protein